MNACPDDRVSGPAAPAPATWTDVAVALRDGRRLAASLWLPARSGPHPAVVVATPYGRSWVPPLLADGELGFGPDFGADYAWVTVDWRGRHDSRAAAPPTPGGLEAHGRDGADVVAWAAAQPWCSGRVGLWGGSALGRVQYHIAVERPAALAAAIPLAAPYGYGYEQFYAGGVARAGYRDTLEVAFGPLRALRRHRRLDATWTSVAARTKPQALAVPLLLVTGWYDLLPEAVIETFRAIRTSGGPAARRHTRLVIGPWTHAAIGGRRQGELEFPAAEGESGREARRFFDRWLRGVGSEPDAAPPVRYFQTGIDVWRTADDWPPPSATATELHLTGEGTLAPAPAPHATERSFTYDPSDPSPTVGGGNAWTRVDPRGTSIGAGPRDQRAQVEERGDCLCYTSAPLAVPVSVVGTPAARLFVASDCADTDVAVRLTDVHPDGRSMLVSDGVRRLRFRHGVEREEWLEPGTVAEVPVTLGVSAHTFRAQHRIRIVVSAANAPRFEPHPNVRTPRPWRRSRVATNRVLHGGQWASRLHLPAAAAAGEARD